MYNLFPSQTDEKHGNNAMLRAAQPRTSEECNNAVNKLRVEVLKQRFIADQGIEPMPRLLGQSARMIQSQEFYPVEIPQNGDSLFQALCTSRKEVWHILYSLREDTEIRAVIAKSILETLVANRIPFHVPDNYKEKIATYANSLKEVKAAYDKIKNDFSAYFFPYELEFSAEAFLLSIDNKMIDGEQQTFIIEEIVAPLKKIVNQYQSLKTQLIEECKKIEMYDHYIFVLRNDMSLNLSIREALIIAKYTQMTVFFWEQSISHPNILNFQDAYQDPNPLYTLNIYYQKNSMCFNLLLDSQLITKSLGNDKFCLDNMLFYNVINLDTDNALLRAVRSPAAGFLVPFLINLGFDVNGRHSVYKNQFLNVLNKTPLHRAIRYFSEYRPKIIEEIGEEMYRNSMESCFTTLVTEGADFSIQELSPGTRKPLHTVLDRAVIGNSRFGWSDPNFKLINWLQDLWGHINGSANAASSLPKINNTMPHKGNFGPVMIQEAPLDANNNNTQPSNIIQTNRIASVSQTNPGANPQSIFGRSIPTSINKPVKVTTTPKSVPQKRTSSVSNNNNNSNSLKRPATQQITNEKHAVTSSPIFRMPYPPLPDSPILYTPPPASPVLNFAPMVSFTNTTTPVVSTRATNVFDMRTQDDSSQQSPTHRK